jgi:hypothetical protein
MTRTLNKSQINYGAFAVQNVINSMLGEERVQSTVDEQNAMVWFLLACLFIYE